LWLADITYCSTWEGRLYVSFILDVYDRMIVGWRVASHMHTDLVLDAFEMATWQLLTIAVLRRPLEPGQFRSKAFVRTLKTTGSSARWDGLAHAVITPQWNLSSRYYKKMFSIDNGGQPERNYA